MRTGPQLRHARRAANLTLAKVARLGGLSASHLSRIESGERPVTPTTVDLYQRAIRDALAELPSPTVNDLRRSSLLALAGAAAASVVTGNPPATDQSCGYPPRPGDEDSSVNRRAVLYGLVGAAGTLTGPAGQLADHLESLRRGVDSEIDSGTANADVDDWERVAFEHAHDVGLLAPERVLPELVADLDEVKARLLRASGKLRVGLARVCGQLSALIAITLLNLDNAQAARRYWRTAIRAVDHTTDRNLQTLIRGRRAVYALYDRRSASTVLALADEAVGTSQGIVCAGTVSGQAARTQALALLGRHDEAQTALRELSTLFARLPRETVTDRRSQWGWSEQRLRHVESHVHSYAGRISDATNAQDAALSLYPPRAYQGPAQVELHRAICQIAAGDPSEGARHLVRTVSSLPTSLRRDALVRRTAALALDVVPTSAAKLPTVSEAHELLALPIGVS